MLGVDFCGWNTLLDILSFLFNNTSLKLILGQSLGTKEG